MTTISTLIHCAQIPMHDIELLHQRRMSVSMKCVDDIHVAGRLGRCGGSKGKEMPRLSHTTNDQTIKPHSLVVIILILTLYLYAIKSKLAHIFILYSFKYLARKLVGGNAWIVSNQRPNNQPLFFSSSVLSTGSQKLHRQAAFAYFLN